MTGGGGKVEAEAEAMAARSPFTVSQWQELEHQALIYKYMMAGLPVPSDLLLPIQKSLRFFHHPTVAVGYCSLYGKKFDPEPGRCRRTDGKKWRCSKDAHPESKYCERHMHRGRNRSRKPVESQSLKQSSSSTMTASFQNLPLRTFGGGSSSISSGNVDSIPYGIPSKDFRYLQGIKSEVDEHSFFSGSHRVVRQMDNTWPVMQSSGNSILQNDYPQQSFFSSSDFSSKEEGQSLRPFFDETSFSTTQLSISIPMASSDFSTTSQSPHR